MSEKENNHNSELSMDELDAVAGGAASVVNSSRSNVKNNFTVATTGAPAGPATAAPAQTPDLTATGN